MFFSIDPHNGVAIYEQIVRQIKFAIAEGIIKSGQMVPSVRVLSQQLTINPNTINRAFQTLQQDGILESARGQGMVVLDQARNRCIKDRQQIITTRLRGALEEALHSGLSTQQINEMVQQQLTLLAASVATVSAVSADGLAPSG